MQFFRKSFPFILLLGLGVVLIGFVLSFFPLSEDSKTIVQTTEPAFSHEGNLSISNKDGELIASFEIEVASSSHETSLGLMYRKSMPENRGMLFIFDREEERSFWMVNTYIALDIIYLNSKKQIVSIVKNATPLTETSRPSNAPAQYALEINAGVSDKFGLKVGDVVDFKIF